jgi:predicted dehydrogenase
MVKSKLRIGMIGAGANARARHLPGFLAIEGVEIAAVCNRRPESTAAIAREFSVPRTYEHWHDLIDNADIDAVVIGTWPYLHCPITLSALEAGKHVLTEARMSMTAREAHQMLACARRHPDLVTQIVPSPYGLKGHHVMRDLIQGGFLGEPREARVESFNAMLADPAAPLSWRQDAALSGFNALTLGIIHETLLRWLPRPVRVLAQAHAHLATRIDPESGVRRRVGTPDTVQVLAVLENGMRATYHLSGVAPFGQSLGIYLYGSHGALHYDLLNDRIYGASKAIGRSACTASELEPIPIPSAKEGGWRVEADFVDSIRDKAPIGFTDFPTGVAYMEFTEGVARSAERGIAIDLPLTDIEE